MGAKILELFRKLQNLTRCLNPETLLNQNYLRIEKSFHFTLRFSQITKNLIVPNNWFINTIDFSSKIWIGKISCNINSKTYTFCYFKQLYPTFYLKSGLDREKLKRCLENYNSSRTHLEILLVITSLYYSSQIYTASLCVYQQNYCVKINNRVFHATII